MGNSFPALIFSVGGQEMVELVMAVRERKRRSLPSRFPADGGDFRRDKGQSSVAWEERSILGVGSGLEVAGNGRTEGGDAGEEEEDGVRRESRGPKKSGLFFFSFSNIKALSSKLFLIGFNLKLKLN